jgi:nucleotide-binding universal stress UspA family protein
LRASRKEDTVVRTILLPLDGSDLARHALPFATFLASATGARLVLTHAYRPRTLDPETDPELDLIREHADLASGLRERGVHAATWLSYGEPGPSIVDLAADLRADLIVMSTHGRGGVGQMMYGSVAEYVAHHSPVPVILVTSRSRTRWVDGQPPRLLVPLDGSGHAERALAPACTLADTLDADLLLLHATDPSADAGIPLERSHVEERRDGARRYLEGVAEPLRAEGRRVEVRVEAGPPADVIAGVANELDSCLVVMATHGRGALSRLLLESIASETLHKLTAPVYLVRPHPAAEAVASGPLVGQAHG